MHPQAFVHKWKAASDLSERAIHRTGAYDCLAAEFEVIEDDKRVIVHGVFAVG